MPDNAVKSPLAGLRIIDSTTMVAMPTTTHIMADMGAEVIKVDSHTLFRPESDRGLYADNDPGEQPWNREGSFNALQRSKLGVTLNLKAEEGVKAFKELARISDVVVENNRPGTTDRLGLGYGELRKEKPDLIYLSNTGFGHTGPWRNYAGIGRMFELTCGLSQFTGYLDEGPRRVGKAFFDLHVGWAAVFAILAALHYCQQTGKGQWLDFGMYQIGVSTMGDTILDFLANGRNGGVMGNRHPCFAPHGVYRCRGEDQWIAIAVENGDQWHGLSQCMDNPAWTREDSFANNTSRRHNQDELDLLISRWTEGYDAQELMAVLQGAGVPASAVENSREVLPDPQLKARGFFERVDHPASTGIGEKLYVGRPWKMSETPVFIRRPAPALGEHNELVLGGLLGRSAKEIENLYELDVLGTTPPNVPEHRPPAYDSQLGDGSLASADLDYRNLLGLG